MSVAASLHKSTLPGSDAEQAYLLAVEEAAVSGRVINITFAKAMKQMKDAANLLHIRRTMSEYIPGKPNTPSLRNMHYMIWGIPI